MDDWVQLRLFPKYSAHPSGVVRHDRKGYILQPQLTQRGVAYVVMQRETRHFSRGLALLIATQFIPQPRERFDTPINLDGDRVNCRVENLAWRPRWFAQQYHRQFEHRWAPIDRKVIDLDTGRTFRDGVDACMAHGLLEKDILLSSMNHTVVFPLMHRFDIL